MSGKDKKSIKFSFIVVSIAMERNETKIILVWI